MPKKGITPKTGADVLIDRRDLGVITAEIHFYKRQAGEAILEIGNRLIEAKEQLQHGEWMDWLENSIDFSDATAHRFMRLAREYSNPSLVTDLGTSKALVLLALPPAERDSFVEETHVVNGEEKNVTDMSKRELDKAVRERAEALEAQAVAEAAAADSKRIAEESDAAMKAADERAEAAQSEADRLQKELEQLRGAEPALPEEQGQQTLEAIREEAAKEAKKEAEASLKKKIKSATDAKKEAEQERDFIRQKAEQEQAAAAEKITQLEKRLAAASSETVTIFKTHFEDAQVRINSMIGCIMKMKDEPDTFDKLTAALRALCEKTIQGLPTAEEMEKI